VGEHAAAAAGHGRGRADREPHDHKRIEAAQKAVEAQNFESRKHVLEYDDVMNKQREAVYGLRRQLMEGVDQKQLITEDYVANVLSAFWRRTRRRRRIRTSGSWMRSIERCMTPSARS
jgi:preprotein translocase subunit SecA